MAAIDDVPRLSGRVPCVPDGKRIYAIGDVHGRLDCLLALEAMIEADLRAAPVERSVQVMLGDYVDRGPQSRGVIAHLIARGRERELVTLRGNHESYLLDVASDPSILAHWCRYGGREALASYGIDLSDLSEEMLALQAAEIARRFEAVLPPDHAAFLAGTRLNWRCGDYLFVHAGIRPGVPLDEQTARDMLWIRHGFLESEAEHGMIVVHGHTPGPEPVIRPNRICIDTQAFASGILTCVVIEGGRRRFLATGRPVEI